MRRLAALAAAVAALWCASPAGAIETQSFGLGPAGSSGRTALHESVKPGATARDAVRVWNKTDAPIAVRLEVQGATLSDAGQVSLGGNEGAARWVSLETNRVTLPPRASVEVPVVVRTPRTMPGGVSTAAVVAQLDADAGGNVAVVQRVALMTYVAAPAGSPLRAALGWIAWVAVAMLALVVVYAGRVRLSGRGRRRRPQALRARSAPQV